MCTNPRRTCFSRRHAVTALAVLLATSAASATAATSDEVQAAVARALPLLQKGAAGHIAKRTCFACHNQALPMLALTTARSRGFTFREADVERQLQFISRFLTAIRDDYRKGRGTGGQVDTAGYALLTLELGGWSRDATTAAVVEYLLQRDSNHDHWRNVSDRPPSEASPFTTTYLAIRALRTWGKADQDDRIGKRIDAARGWLLKTPAKDTEDRVFRLRGLQASGAADKDLQPAVQELLHVQRKDGGWAQTDALDSDAYATGSALVALHQAGGLSVSDSVYQRGVAFLLKDQHADGSWFVHSRSKPFQTYYESGFPHGKDQFISMAASGWAATALALASDPVANANAARRPEPPAATEPFSMKTYVYKTVGDTRIEADVFRPADEKVRPVLVWIHGGALLMGNRGSVPRLLLDQCKAEGYALVSLDYRLAPEVKLPAIIEDIQDAFRWLREQGPRQLHIDPDRVVVAGGSAGGYLTLMSGFCVKPRPRALVAYWGYGDVAGDWYAKPSEHYRKAARLVPKDEAYRSMSGKLVTGVAGGEEQKARSRFYLYLRQNGLWGPEVTGFDPLKEPRKLDPFCPVHNVSADYPPTLLIHGTEDTDVPYDQSVGMAKELARHKVAHELVTVKGAGHGLSGGDRKLIDQANEKAAEFIRSHLKPTP
jgi:acetyl esterase/lipase